MNITLPNKKQKAREAQHRYRLRHPDRVKALRARYLAECPDRVRAIKKASNVRHRQTATEYQRRWRKKNPERALELAKESRQRHAMKVAACNRQWKLDNPEKVRAYRSTSKARRRVRTQTRLSSDLVSRLLELQQTRCAICCKKLVKYHLDHIVPLALGGPHEDANIQLLCPPCNVAKSCKDPGIFMREHGKLL